MGCLRIVCVGVVGCVVGGVLAQDPGEGERDGVFEPIESVRITYSYAIQGGTHGWSVWFERTLEIESIRGVDRELEPMEGGESGARIEGAELEKRAVDLARMFLRGELDTSAVREHIRSCTDPGCVHHGVVTGVGDQGSVEGAIGGYAFHLDAHPEDWMVMRELSYALLAAKRDSDAVALMARAYGGDPSIGMFPVNPALFGEMNDGALRALVRRAVAHTQREETGEAWLLVAVLMQSEGRTDRALAMVDRAVERGLDPALVSGLRDAME